MDKYVGADVRSSDAVGIEIPYRVMSRGQLRDRNYVRTVLILCTGEDRQSERLSPIDLRCGRCIRANQDKFANACASHLLSGLAIVLVDPTGLTEAVSVQSANWYQYLVSGFRPVASTLTVKSTSYDVNAEPASTGLPERVEELKIL